MGSTAADTKQYSIILNESGMEAIVCTRGVGINALSIVRALGRSGIRVYVIASDLGQNLVSLSRYCVTAVEFNQTGSDEFCRVLRATVDQCDNRPLLYIDNDLHLQYFLGNKELEKEVLFTGSVDLSRKLLDKKNQVLSAIEAGLDVPESWFPLSWDEISTLRSVSGKRLIAKKRFPLNPERDEFKVLSAQDGKTLCRELQKYRIRPEELFVQEYISGHDTDVYFALCYQPFHVDYPAIVTGRKLIQSGSGDGGIMILGTAEQNKTVRNLTTRYIKYLGYWGYFGIEFKYCREKKKYYFIEVNTRPERCNALARVAGVDLDCMSYLDAVGHVKVGEAAGKLQHPGVWLDGRKIFETLRRQRRRQDFIYFMKALPKNKEWAVWALDDMKPFWRYFLKKF
jgi:predicted ATP-grasp superfamily ATP-dependent carboligase